MTELAFFFALAVFVAIFSALAIYWIRLSKLTPTDGDRLTLTITSAQFKNWQIRYHQSGRGPDLVLIHGIGADLLCWRDLIPRLNDRYRVLALDLPGFGQSSKIRGERYGLDEQVERLAEFLSQIGVHKYYVVGNSMGGNIALWMALRYPDRVLGLSLIAPALNPRSIPISLDPWLWLAGPVSMGVNRALIHWAHRRTVSQKDRVDDLRVKETLSTYGRNPDAIRSFMSATSVLRDPRLIQQVGDLRCPVQILWGSRDLLVNQKMIKRLEKALPSGFESHVHLGGGHHLQEDEPDWVAEKIDALFRPPST